MDWIVDSMQAEIAKDVGYLPSENCYYNDLKVREMLQYTADLYGMVATAGWRNWQNG